MRFSPPRTFIPLLLVVACAPFAVVVAGCDQLNKPMGHPSGSGGLNNTRSGSPNSDGGKDDGSANSDNGPNSPILPGITAQPGDIQL